VTTARADLVIVGAGIVGLAHAAEAVARGLSVVVVERDSRPVGASIRNFGHGCVTGQAGNLLELARSARRRWIEVGAAAGFWVGETGAVVVARADDERAVLEELVAERGDEVLLLDAAEVCRRVAVHGEEVVAGAHLALDVRVDPVTAVPAMAAWLARQPGVSFEWATSLVGVEPGLVRTSRGVVQAGRTVVCVGHDLDRVFPDIATEAGVQRCQLHMLRVDPPGGARFDPAVLSGTSLIRYPAFAGCPSAPEIRARLERDQPELLAAGVNLMFTQRPDGVLTIGDTHEHDQTVDPFRREDLDALLLTEVARLLGVERLRVRERWQGVYASAADDYLVAAPVEGARVVSITSGVGMTIALGLAPIVLDDLLV
jgi:D-hydroxyproline dehydrogenase subunit beta